MPNWCWGNVSVKGEPKNVEAFCKLFLFEEDIGDEELSKKYFARSFIDSNWKNFKKDHLGESEAQFGVNFAWSCWSCLIDGYPTDPKRNDRGNCVTLEWACKKYNVYVTIESEEGGMGFEENIIANKNGVDYNSYDMPCYECENCGNNQLISSSYELDEENCCECDEYGKWKTPTEVMVTA